VPSSPANVPPHQAVAALEARLNRLPLQGPVLLVIFIGAASYLFDFYDQVSIGAVSKPLRTQLELSLEDFGLAVSVSYASLTVGAIVGGWLADRVGRRVVLTASVLVLAGGSALVGLLSTDLLSLIVTRAVVGLGMGVLYPVALTYLVEMLPVERRGRAVAIAFFFGSVGTVLATQAARWLVPLGPDGWRWVFVVGVVGVVVLVPVLRLPESPRWLLSKGRTEEADAAVARLERMATRAIGRPLAEPADVLLVDAADASATTERKARTSELLRKPYLLPLVLLSVAWVAQTGATLVITQFTPTILDLRGFSVEVALTVASVITLGMLVGSFLASAAAKRITGGRAAAIACVVAGLASAAFGLSGNTPLIVVGGFLTWVMMGIFTPLLLRVMSEQWPSYLRARGNGIAFAVGRVAAIVAPVALVAAVTSLGVDSAGWTMLALWLVTAIAMWLVALRGPDFDKTVLARPSTMAARPADSSDGGPAPEPRSPMGRHQREY